MKTGNTSIPRVAVAASHLRTTDGSATTRPSADPAETSQGRTTAADGYDGAGAGTARPLTALQKHVKFFDFSNTNRITPYDTFHGMRLLGWNPLKATGAAVIVNFALGARMYHGIPWPVLDLNKIDRDIHDSDSGVYDRQGNYAKEKVDQLFEKFDTNNDGLLSESEVKAMREANRKSFLGHLLSGGEFPILMDVAGRTQMVDGKQEKVLTREQLHDFYTGDLFYKMTGRPIPDEFKNG